MSGRLLRFPDPGPASQRFRDRFLHLLGRDDPPESVAAAFAVGVAISFTPLIGFHWMMALALAILLRLNKVDVFLGTLVVNPLTLGPTSVAAVWIGRLVLFAQHEAEAHPPLHQLFTRNFWDGGLPAMKSLGLQWATGMFVLTGLAGALTYVGLLWVLKRRAARRAARVSG
ncbi:DUF2062 domain-containing protein [Acidobacteria bacterium ACD]|nr:DUF2062 domain-containing protein [Acidobacteria bacterium ACD]